MDSPPLVNVTGLTRRFGARVALDRLDFSQAAGEIVGLLGPNGSGKTTLLKILAGFLRPTHGTVRVLGLDPFRDRCRVMEGVRFAFAPPPLYESLTGREHLEHLTALRARGVPAVDRTEIDRALSLAGLSDRAGDRVRAYSFGMRQRLALAQALLPLPRLLVLDEPTDGLDPLAVLELRGVLRRLRDERGVSILLATHLLAEVEHLVDRLLVLDEGRTLFQGRPETLLTDGARIRLEVDDPGTAFSVLASAGFSPSRNGSQGLLLSRGALGLDEARDRLAGAGVRLIAFHEERPNLEGALLERLRSGREENGPKGGEA